MLSLISFSYLILFIQELCFKGARCASSSFVMLAITNSRLVCFSGACSLYMAIVPVFCFLPRCESISVHYFIIHHATRLSASLRTHCFRFHFFIYVCLSHFYEFSWFLIVVTIFPFFPILNFFFCTSPGMSIPGLWLPSDSSLV